MGNSFFSNNNYHFSPNTLFMPFGQQLRCYLTGQADPPKAAGGRTENLFLSPPNLPYRRGGT